MSGDYESGADSVREMYRDEQDEPGGKVLCPKCKGDGVLKIPGGVSECDRCNGWCEVYQPAGSTHRE